VPFERVQSIVAGDYMGVGKRERVRRAGDDNDDDD
jgi:hypothetical protein